MSREHERDERERSDTRAENRVRDERTSDTGDHRGPENARRVAHARHQRALELVERIQHRAGERGLGDQRRDCGTDGAERRDQDHASRRARPRAPRRSRSRGRAAGAPRREPSCQAWPDEDQHDREDLDLQRGGCARVLIAAERDQQRPRPESHCDRDEQADDERRLRHRLDRAGEATPIVAPRHREHGKRSRQHQRRQAPQHLERAERRAEVPGLRGSREEPAEDHEHSEVDHAQRERDRDRKRLAKAASKRAGARDGATRLRDAT